MTSYCFVLDLNGQRLSPTKENKGWYLIRKNRAKLVNKFPMVIQLLKEIPLEQIDKTPVALGIDDGAKYTGIALVQDGATKNKPVFKGTIEHRQDVKDKMGVRRDIENTEDRIKNIEKNDLIIAVHRKEKEEFPLVLNKRKKPYFV